MTRTEFFDAIKSECAGQREYLIELLKLRGFLLEEKDEIVLLSDNSHIRDEAYLDKLLKKYGFGRVSDHVLKLEEDIDASLFEQEFAENTKIAMEVTGITRGWGYFRQRKHGIKAPVECLEPFIARYVKAISACCVMTVGCCDGNHPGKNKMNLQLIEHGSVVWHRLICKYLVEAQFDIQWINDYTAIEISANTKYKMYYELNKAAEVIYDKRMELREIKDQVLWKMSNSYLRHANEDEIAEKFEERVSVLLANM